MNLKICHLLPHLGGGVGKAITTLVQSTASLNISHDFILFENPVKKQFYEKIIDLGCDIFVTPDRKTVDKLVRCSDIIQLEWWNHPATFQFLCDQDLPKMRLLIWSHVSGLHFPLIPIKLISIADMFLFTSECSYQAENIVGLDEKYKSRLDVVSSGVGFSQENYARKADHPFPCCGYMGSLNPSKLYPQFIDYLSYATVDNFKVHIWGDEYYKDVLVNKCRQIGKKDLIEFHGYTTNPADVLRDLDVFVYLLNPSHYGTAENVLLEAMSLGVVPIVMNNPAETAIVDHDETGFVVSSPKEFAETVEWLFENPLEIKRIATNASEKIAGYYTPEIMADAINIHYDYLMNCSKKIVDFRDVLGKDPYEWYMACQDTNKCNEGMDDFNNYKQVEETKGSLKHYISYFPDNIRLKYLADTALTNS